MRRFFPWRTSFCLTVVGCLLGGCQRGPRTVSPDEPAGKAVQVKQKPKVVVPAKQPELVRLRTIPTFRQWGVRETATDALARIGDAAVPTLIETLHDPDGEVRAQAAQALARMGEKAAPAIDALIKALNDPEAEVRRGAARALGQIGPEAEEAIPALIDAIKDPRNKRQAQSVEVEQAEPAAGAPG